MRGDKAFLIHYARVLHREARARRGSSFAELLLKGAARARREAMAIVPIQPDLFASTTATDAMERNGRH